MTAPSHATDRLHLSFTITTPLATVAPLLSRVTQYWGGHFGHPAVGHGGWLP